MLAVPGRCAQGGAAPGVRASRRHEPRTRARRGGQGLLVVARGDTTSDSPDEGAGRWWIQGAAAVAPHARGRPWVRQRRLDKWRRAGGPNRGASPPQWVWSRPAMASVEKGMGERGVNDGLHLTTMNTSGSTDDDTWSFGGRRDASSGRVGEGRPRRRCAGQRATPRVRAATAKAGWPGLAAAPRVVGRARPRCREPR